MRGKIDQMTAVREVGRLRRGQSMSQQQQQETPADDLDKLLDRVAFVEIEPENEANSVWWPCLRFPSMKILERVTKKWNLYEDAASKKERGKAFLYFLPVSNSYAGALLFGENPLHQRFIFDSPDTPLSFKPLLENIVEFCDQYRDDSEFMNAVMVVQSTMTTGPVALTASGSLTTAVVPPHVPSKTTAPTRQVAPLAASAAAVVPLSRNSTCEKGPASTRTPADVTCPHALQGRKESGQKRKAAPSGAAFASNQNPGGKMPPLKKKSVQASSSVTTRQQPSRRTLPSSPTVGRADAVTAPRHRLMKSPPMTKSRVVSAKESVKADELKADSYKCRTSRSGRPLTLSRAKLEMPPTRTQKRTTAASSVQLNAARYERPLTWNRETMVVSCPSFAEVRPLFEKGGYNFPEIYGERSYVLPFGETFQTLEAFRHALCADGVPCRCGRIESLGDTSDCKCWNDCAIDAIRRWVRYNVIQGRIQSGVAHIIPISKFLELITKHLYCTRNIKKEEYRVPGNETVFDYKEFVDFLSRFGLPAECISCPKKPLTDQEIFDILHFIALVSRDTLYVSSRHILHA
jgi:hypothetical protein